MDWWSVKTCRKERVYWKKKALSWKKKAVKIIIFEWSGKTDKETTLGIHRENLSKGGFDKRIVRWGEEVKELSIWAFAKSTVRKERSGRAVKQLRYFHLD